MKSPIRGTSSFAKRQPWWPDLMALLVSAAALWASRPFLDDSGAGLLLLPGLLLLVGAFAGRVSVRCHLPRLTGYILVGALAGPDLIALVSKSQVDTLKSINDLAIGLIALMAGAEIRVSWLKARLGQIITCAVAKTLITPLMVATLVYFGADLFPFIAALKADGHGIVYPAILVGFVALASSPMVVVSVIKENRSAGPLSEMAIGVAVGKDLLVLLGFTLMLAITDRALSPSDAETTLFMVGGQAMLHVLVSVLLGLPIGWALAWLSEREYTRLTWLLVGVSLAVALLEPIFHIEPLFCLLSAGFVCENLWPKRSAWGTHHLERSLNLVAAPVFVIFFVKAGLSLDLKVLAAAWPAVLALVCVRAASFYASLEVACRLSRTRDEVRRWLWLGMVPQAGVTLGLAAIIADTFPGSVGQPSWGELLSDLLIGCVAIHELIGPILLTMALKRSGETDRT